MGMAMAMDEDDGAPPVPPMPLLLLLLLALLLVLPSFLLTFEEAGLLAGTMGTEAAAAAGEVSVSCELAR